MWRSIDFWNSIASVWPCFYLFVFYSFALDIDEIFLLVSRLCCKRKSNELNRSLIRNVSKCTFPNEYELEKNKQSEKKINISGTTEGRGKLGHVFDQKIPFLFWLIKHSTFVSSFKMWRNSIYLKSMLIKNLNQEFKSQISMFLVTVFCRTNRVCEFCPVNKLTFSKWCATYVLVCINDLTISMLQFVHIVRPNVMCFNNWISKCISHFQTM